MHLTTILAMFFAASKQTGGPPSTGPAGPPTNPSNYCYGGNLVGVQWTNGDPEALTQVLRNGVVQTTVGAGTTTYETAFEDSIFNADTWTARHVKNGQPSTSITFPDAICEPPQ